MEKYTGFNSENFGRLTFNKKSMARYLAKSSYAQLLRNIEQGDRLERDLAKQVAHAMKEWAISKGATHFTHWFQPQRGGATAEKHDAFLTVLENGEVLERFTGKQLIKGEPDASSFPSGGMRTTFEARGYTAWDPSSPAFISQTERSRTLVIPSVFFSFTGEVLDMKTPLLRSLDVVEKRALKLLRFLGNRSSKYVRTTVGPEQEYFVVDKKFYDKRIDLLMTGRTLIGNVPAKHQQMEDHYFGAIKPRILEFMHDLDVACFERGIPAKTRHNEVSPAQFEIAPFFERANIAVDHNLQLMDLMKAIAEKHGLVVLLHEKPFDGVNGSGKHINWSLSDSENHNLLEPGISPKKNIQFLLFLSAVLLGVHKHGHLIRASVAEAGNDHRLGANEAPPPIMSVFLGENIEKLLDDIRRNDFEVHEIAHEIDLGLRNLPQFALDSMDRNRTSPIAFTGDKFEIRAAGSSSNISEPVTELSLAVADGLDAVLSELEERKDKYDNIRTTALEVVQNIIEETSRVRFTGNNYDVNWLNEAKTRGLPIATNTPSALKCLLEKDIVSLYEKYNIINKNEIKARWEIRIQAYIKTLHIELKTLKEMAETIVFPSLVKQIAEVTKAYEGLRKSEIISSSLKDRLDKYTSLLSELDNGTKGVQSILDTVHKDIESEAVFLGDEGMNKLNQLRQVCDQIEQLVDNNLWNLPKYHDLLFKL